MVLNVATHTEWGRMNWHDLSQGLSRKEKPLRLGIAYFSTELSLDGLREGLEDAWTSAEWPLSGLQRWVWLEMFRKAGYLEGSVPATRPGSPIKLFRGSPLATRRRLSWTGDLDKAQWFAERYPGGSVWSVAATPDSLLAHFNSRNEDEYVVDVTGLRVAVVD